MRICMVTRHSCIRVFKEGFALSQAGHRVDLITNMTTFGYNVFNSMYVYNDRDMMIREVEQAARDVDLFHVHNEPDWLVPAVRSVTDKPIVYDIHDLGSLRWQADPDQDEIDSFVMSDGWIHVSEPCRIHAERYHGNTKPHITIPSYINKTFIVPDPPGDVGWNNVVYEGGLASDHDLGPRWRAAGNNAAATNFRNYVPVVKAFAEQGYNFHLYSMSKVDVSAYGNVGGVVIQELSPAYVWLALRSYGFGLVGASKDYPLMQAALPNKLFEYIGQGVVPICYNADEAANFCEEHGIGIRLDGLENLREQLATGPECRERLLALRDEFAMENHIGQVEELYEAIL